METKLLQLLNNQSLSIVELNNELKQPSLKTLSQIAKINGYFPGLITTKNGRYMLAKKLDWLDQTKLLRLIKDKKLGFKLHLLDQTDSTNSYTLRNITQFENKTIISTDWQNSGRGRFGRSWISKIAEDLTVSILYTFEPEFNISLLPAICAVAINRLLKNHAIKNQIKWPNDIYVNKEKVAGVLVENLVRGKHFKTVIGIGLNNFAAWDRNALLIELVENVDNIINEFKLFGFALLRREWLDNCLHLNKAVTIKKNGIEIDKGIHKDINEKGELLIATESGEVSYSNSEISLIFED